MKKTMKKYYVAFEQECYDCGIRGDWVWKKGFASFDDKEEAEGFRHDIIDSINSFRNVTNVMENKNING